MGIINAIRHYRPSIRMATLLATLGPLVIAIGTVLLTVNHYETDLLIKQTESKITNEAVLIAGIYKDRFEAVVPNLEDRAGYGKNIPVVWHEDDTLWHFEPAVLSIQDLGESPELPRPGFKADPMASHLGRTLEKTLRRFQGTNVSQIDLLDMNGVIVASTMREYDPGYSIGHREDVIEALNGKVTKRLRANKIEHNHVSLVCVWKNLKTFFLGDRSGNDFDPDR